MKKNLMSVAVATFAFILMGAGVSKNAIKYKNGIAIVNTSSIVKARGLNSKTPIKIYIKGNKITKIESLPNQETPAVFASAERLLKKFIGKSVDEASTMKVDGVSGATYSSKALIQNVKGGLNYYKENKK
ncbi:FMN-binding protein [uncultured Prevotella sp.]|uniref:FMN-binding protein n=1 Tax=uncultured Prevotella sp. TaxID=159272 RepID=UPI0027E23E1F|nr:FMN-binding protein [uncultured Prevotella sp.]